MSQDLAPFDRETPLAPTEPAAPAASERTAEADATGRRALAPRLLPGDVVADKYRIEETAGEGGMAVIYAAHHLVLDQRVAVKVLIRSEDGAEPSTERFLREAQASARLHSEHAARVMDAGVLPAGQPYLVMELLEGCDLEELVAVGGPLPASEAVDYLLQALEGMAHAHAAGIVHRDVKPANLFLATCSNGSSVIKVVDFGISKSLLGEADPSAKRLTGKAVLGSPAYMSPEQVRNASDVDARTDVWSLGVTLYELLTGRIPFDGDGVGAMLAAILEADPLPPRALRPDLPEGLSEVVLRCCARDRGARWSDVAELAAALAPYGSGAYAAYPNLIAATLENAARLHPPTPFATPPAASLRGSNPEILHGEGSGPRPAISFALDRAAGLAAAARAPTRSDPRLIATQAGPKLARPRRGAMIALACLGVGLALTVFFRTTPSRSASAEAPLAAAAAVEPGSPATGSESAAQITAAAAAPQQSPAAETAPASPASQAAAVPTASAPPEAASPSHAPNRGKATLASPPTTSARPALLHSRN